MRSSHAPQSSNLSRVAGSLNPTYMTQGELCEDEILARQLIWWSNSMTIANGELHHRSVTGACQCCVSPEEGHEIHEGDCGHHAGSKSLVAKAFRHGFCWLTAHADAEDLVSKCDGCKKIMASSRAG